jgi:hypothetical protein
MKISKREMTLGVLTLAAVLAGSTWYIVDSKVGEWKGKALEIEKLEQQIRLHQNAIKMQEEWLGELNELQAQLPVFDTGRRSVSPELMKTIKALASKHGVAILRSNPRGEKPTGDLFELGINCTWEGSLDAMVRFLTDLQQQGVRYDARTLSVSPIGKNTGKLKGNMVIHCAFTRKPAAPEQK